MSALSSATSTRTELGPASGADRSGAVQEAASATAAESVLPVAGARAGPAASPYGTRTTKLVPAPTSLVTCTSPPSSAVSSLTSARPMPEPSWLRARVPLTRWKRSNSRGTSSGGMPTPVSTTSSRAPPAPSPPLSSCRRTQMRPAKVNFRALESRLVTTFSQWSGSSRTGRGSGGQSTSRASPPRSTAARKPLATAVVRAARSTGCSAVVALPASTLEKVSRSSTSLRSRCDPRSAVSTRSRCTAGSGASSSATASPSGPSMSVSGVRNSWLTLVKNTVLARSSSASASARARSSSYARAVRSAPAACWASRAKNDR